MEELLQSFTLLHAVELFIAVYMLVSGILMVTGKKTSLSRRTQEVYTEESIRKAMPLIGSAYTLLGVFAVVFVFFSVKGVTGKLMYLITGFMLAAFIFLFFLYFTMLKHKNTK